MLSKTKQSRVSPKWRSRLAFSKAWGTRQRDESETGKETFFPNAVRILYLFFLFFPFSQDQKLSIVLWCRRRRRRGAYRRLGVFFFFPLPPVSWLGFYLALVRSFSKPTVQYLLILARWLLRISEQAGRQASKKASKPASQSTGSSLRAQHIRHFNALAAQSCRRSIQALVMVLSSFFCWSCSLSPLV